MPRSATFGRAPTAMPTPATAGGWASGITAPSEPDPGKLPVVLCHGLGLNGTFWTITDDHLPAQLDRAGLRGLRLRHPGLGRERRRSGRLGRINQCLRADAFLRAGRGSWNVDDLVRYDVPAILDYVERETGHDRVNWVGHSLGGMLMFPYLELSPRARADRQLRRHGEHDHPGRRPHRRDMLARQPRPRAMLCAVVSTGRLGRPLMYFRLPGPGPDRPVLLHRRERRPAGPSRGSTATRWRTPAPARCGSSTRTWSTATCSRPTARIDYSARLGEVTTPTLLIAGEADCISDVPSTELTFDALGSPDKTLMRFGKRHGHVADYGHCDLVWSRYAPAEIFPAVIDWLDQPPAEAGAAPRPPMPRRGRLARRDAGRRTGPQQRVDADLRPGLELVPEPAQIGRSGRTRRRPAPPRAGDVGALELVEVDDAQVDPADGRGVVVDQADAAHPAGAVDLDLLVELAAQGHLVGVEARAALGVGLGDVPAHARATAAGAAAPRPATCPACSRRQHRRTRKTT